MSENDVFYKYHVWRRHGKYYGHIRELAVLISDDNPASLIDRLETEKRSLVEAYGAAGIESEIPTPISKAETRHLRRDLLRFLSKTAIVVVVVSIVIVVAKNQIIGILPGPRAVVEMVAAKLRSYPEETRGQTRENLRIIVEELRPYAQEIKPLINELFGADRCGDGRETSSEPFRSLSKRRKGGEG